jgi:hypothetical protein
MLKMQMRTIRQKYNTIHQLIWKYRIVAKQSKCPSYHQCSSAIPASAPTLNNIEIN